MSDRVIEELEQRRLRVQRLKDAAKSQAERNRMGQFATPPALALDILAYARSLLPETQPIRFLDPALGTGAFYAALLRTFPPSRIEQATGFEIDSHYGRPARELWQDIGLEVRLADFTRATPSARYNLLICNPPYVRHHHMANGEKARLQMLTEQASGICIGGLAGLYCHYLALSHAWMDDDGLAGWLIPSEFMDVNYGKAVKRYFLEQVTLSRIHRFDPSDMQFADAWVSSTVVWFRKALPRSTHEILFTFGGTLAAPKLSRIVTTDMLRTEAKWTRFPLATVRSSSAPRIADFFAIKRGLATGDNSYFILTEEKIKEHGLPVEMLRPILPSPRHLMEDIVEAREDGTPDIARRLFLLDCPLPPEEVRRRFPRLWAYLEAGRDRGLDQRYLCRHRTPWYVQERRPPTPFLCTYLGRSETRRGKPFRFILNRSNATVANVYLALYPKPRLAQALADDPKLVHAVWQELARITPTDILGEGRVYGGGLHKLEPKELANVPAPGLAALLAGTGESFTYQSALLETRPR